MLKRQGLTSFDSMYGDEEGYAEALPEREEEDTLDAEEFGCRKLDGKL